MAQMRDQLGQHGHDDPEADHVDDDGGQHDRYGAIGKAHRRSEEHTSELQSLMRISYAVFCLKKKNKYRIKKSTTMIYLSHTSTHQQAKQTRHMQDKINI